MHSFEQLVSMLIDVNDHLSEAAPPPFKAAERAKVGMPALKSRTGATPPPIPKAKPQVLMQTKKKAIVQPPTPKGDKSLGIKRGFSMHTARDKDGIRSTDLDKSAAIGWAGKHVAARAAKGEALATEIRDLLGEGGGSRASKVARQDANYTAKTGGTAAPGNDRISGYERQKARGLTRAMSGQPDKLAARERFAKNIEAHKKSGKGWIGGKPTVGAAVLLKKR